MNTNSSRFFHHFIPKNMPAILLPTSVTSSMFPSVLNSPLDDNSDHILNLSASMSRHCPPSPIPPIERKLEENSSGKKNNCRNIEMSSKKVDKKDLPEDDSCKVQSSSEPNGSGEDSTDMNSNQLMENETKLDDHDISKDSCPSSQETANSDEEQIMEIDVDDTSSSLEDEALNLESGVTQSKDGNVTEDLPRKVKTLTFGIDQILSSGRSERVTTSPPLSPKLSSPPPSPSPVVPNLSSKSTPLLSPLISKRDDTSHHHHHSILSKLKLCVTATSSSSSTVPAENHKRSTPTGATLPSYFHHSYGSYHHHHHPINSVITSASGGGIHNHNSHQHHPLSNCSECVYLRRYCGGGSIGRNHSGPSCNNRPNNIPSSSANTGVTNNMQFSSSMATPCGPTSSLSASFTWMPNLSIYDNPSIISPSAGYNHHQHIPLQPSFGLGTSGYSTLATIQHGNSGSGTGRRKRSWSRAVFSSLQRKGLEKRFQLQKYITKPDRRQLAASLGLTDAQNRRMKWRHSKEAATATASSSSPPVSSTTPSTKSGDGASKDKKS